MKNTIKVFGIITLVAVIGISMAACDDGNGKGGDGNGKGDDGKVKTISGTVKAIESPNHSNGRVCFVISLGTRAEYACTVDFTTNMPGHQSFTLVSTSLGIEFDDLTVGTVYEWTATSSDYIMDVTTTEEYYVVILKDTR